MFYHAIRLTNQLCLAIAVVLCPRAYITDEVNEEGSRNDASLSCIIKALRLYFQKILNHSSL